MSALHKDCALLHITYANNYTKKTISVLNVSNA